MHINFIGIIGPGRNQCSVKFLQRAISYSSTGADRGFTWQGDEKHALRLIESLGLTNSKAAATPGTKFTVKNLPNCEDYLADQATKEFQSNAGTLLHHSLDDPRVQFEASMVMTGM